MFDVAPTELLLVAVVAVVVIGPKDLPRAMRFAGYWVGRARGVARQFRQGFDDMVRESELAEMEKKWAAENERIMREFPGHETPTPAALPAPADDGSDTPPVMAAAPDLIDPLQPPSAAASSAIEPELTAPIASKPKPRRQPTAKPAATRKPAAPRKRASPKASA